MKRALGVVAWPAILCGIAAIAVLLHPGDRAMAEKICTSVGGTLGTFGVADDSVCGGSIAWLQQSLAQAHANVMVAARVHHSFSLYGLLAIPALLPAIAALVMLYRRDAAQREVKIIATCSAVAVAGSLVDFLHRTRLGPMDSHPCGMPDAASVDGEPRGAACGTTGRSALAAPDVGRQWPRLRSTLLAGPCLQWTFFLRAPDFTVCTGICGATDRPT